jgi:two-component system, cell cycle sensor histidine kinase and response regulator CckA
VKRVLIVDDHEENLYLLQVLLQSQGYAVDLACNGAEALEKAHAQRPDLIVSDILMPVMDGFALCRAWKADEQLKGVPFVFYTATYTDPRDERLAMELGADAFIVKPAEPDVLLALTADMLERAEAGQLTAANAVGGGEDATLKQYSEALVRKLEKKMLELERVNEELQRGICERQKTEEALRQQVVLDELVENVLSQTVSASPTELGAIIESALQSIAVFMHVDGALVFLASEDRKNWQPAYRWADSSAGALLEALKRVRVGVFPWVEKELREGRTICLRSLDDLPPQAADLRMILQRQHRHSALIVPLHGSGSLLQGCLVLAAVEERPGWQEQDVRHAEQLAKAVASALSRKYVEESLQASDERLRQAQKMEAIGQLAGGIAHDFNNLLTAILGYSDLILIEDDFTPMSKAGTEAIREIRNAAQRAAMLTRQILAFSRRQELRPEVISLNVVAAEVRPLLDRTLGEHVNLTFEFDAELGMCEVDPNQLASVLMNLAVNARDAMPQGGKLTVATSNIELDEEYCLQHGDCQPGAYVMLAVSDTGMGMDRETQARIFEPFFTTKDPGKGTGLGLSTVHGVVKQSGGHVFVYSELGSGTTFKIYLPRSEREPQPEASAPAVERQACGGETILVVEDEEMLRLVIQHVLEAEGYRVRLAGRGEEALALLGGEHLVQLLLTDLVLPGTIQGAEVVRRALEIKPGLAVLCMSGYSRNYASGAAMVDPAVSYLEKPFTGAGLIAKVRQVLDGR